MYCFYYFSTLIIPQTTHVFLLLRGHDTWYMIHDTWYMIYEDMIHQFLTFIRFTKLQCSLDHLMQLPKIKGCEGATIFRTSSKRGGGFWTILDKREGQSENGVVLMDVFYVCPLMWWIQNVCVCWQPCYWFTNYEKKHLRCSCTTLYAGGNLSSGMIVS